MDAPNDAKAEEYFVVYPSSNASKHGVRGPFPSEEAAAASRGLSGGLVCRRHGDYFGILVSFDWLWDWELETFPSTYARRMIENRAAWHKSHCEFF